MTDRYEALRKAAEACGKERWNSNGDFVYCAHLSIARCSGDLYHPSGTPIDAHEQARYIALANPFAVLHLLAERDALAAQVEALKVDAERYRWIRDKAWYVDAAKYAHELEVRYPGSDDYTGTDEIDVENAIDAARKEQS